MRPERLEHMTDRLAISFWIWGLFDAVPNGFFDFNEADGLDFVGFYGEKTQPKEQLNLWRSWHEDALEFVKARHPGLRFALDTYTPYVNPEHVPRNMQVWNFHKADEGVTQAVKLRDQHYPGVPLVFGVNVVDRIEDMERASMVNLELSQPRCCAANKHSGNFL